MISFNSTFIKNAFIGQNQIGSSASVNLVEDIESTESITDMQIFTKKLNLPISCFIKQTNMLNRFYIRYFIKDNEEPICGHGTLVATKFLIDNNLINSNKVEYIPLMTPNKPIIATINNNLISIFIQTIKPKHININSEIGQKITKSITHKNNIKLFNIIEIVEGELDYTIEISKNHNNISSNDVIKSIVPDFGMIEQIKLSSGKLCRGIDVVIKNNEKTEVAQEDFISRIFLPLGADIKYKEDPACGSENAYITRYLIEKYPTFKTCSIKIYQASSDGAIIITKNEDNGIIKVSGYVG